jgi:hypothetical protein
VYNFGSGSSPLAVAYPGTFFGGWGVSKNSVEDRRKRERESGGQ